MIIHHQTNVAAFAGAHTWYWILQPLLFQRISVTTVAAASKMPPVLLFFSHQGGTP